MRRVLILLALLGCDDAVDEPIASDGARPDALVAADASPVDGAALADAALDLGADAAPRDAAPAPDADAVPRDTAPAPDTSAPDADSPDADSPDAGPSGCYTTATVAGVEVFAYEASRADATAEAGGEVDDACSRPGALPWTGLTVAEAGAACEAAGFALCTGAQWQRICGGEPGTAEHRAFPYGNAHTPGTCNDHVSGSGALEPTGARPGCVTPEGVFDLSGNVWELVAAEGRRGASYRADAVNHRVDAARCDREIVVSSFFYADDLGFRCCREALE